MTKTFLIHPCIVRNSLKIQSLRTSDDALEELQGLAEAIHLEVTGAEIVNLPKINSSTYLGKGTVERFQGLIKAFEVNLVVLNCKLGPVQQRNLEKAWQCKVIDRTGLILEIFGARAQTREGALQVELAALTYQRSRLVRSWTHLERQRGGFGFIGGPGESQLELDRRILDDRVIYLKSCLDKIIQMRSLHRRRREKNHHPIVALIGYTNAGKSTLFNSLTGANVKAENQLFATLDPTLRPLKIKGGQSVLLSDTVGFISNLPTELVAAFRATLEEVIFADVLVHVQDVSHPEWKAQAQDVVEVLKNIGIEPSRINQMLNVFNKIDLLNPDQKEALSSKSKDLQVAISAKTGFNYDKLIEKIRVLSIPNQSVWEMLIACTEGQFIAWLYENGHIQHRQIKKNNIFMRVGLDEIAENRFNKMWQNKCIKIRRVW